MIIVIEQYNFVVLIHFKKLFMKLNLILSIIVILFQFSCTDEETFVGDDRQKMSELEISYKLTKVSNIDIDLDDLQETSIDSLANFLYNFERLRGIKIPIVMQAGRSNRLHLAIDSDRLNIPSLKTRSETVLVSEMLFVSLATLRMNVWLDISIPSVVTSELSGLTVFDRWEQKSADASKNGSIINFNVYGVWYYKLFVDGIGDFYSYTASFSGSYNTVTGKGDLNVL